MVTYHPLNSLPILLIIEAKHVVNNAAVSQVVGELLCAYSMNFNVGDARKDVYATLTDMGSWRFFRYDGTTTQGLGGAKALPVIYSSPKLHFVDAAADLDWRKETTWHATVRQGMSAVLKLLMATIEV